MAIEVAAAGDALCRRRDRRRDRLSGASGYGVRGTLFASAAFSMAHFKAAPVRRTCTTRARATGEGIADHVVLLH